MRRIIQAYKGARIMVVLLGLTGSFAVIASAEEPYSKSAEMICDNVRITVVTECYDDSAPVLPLCSKQYFEFLDRSTEKTITIAASGKLKNDNELATSWACVKGKMHSYILVRYNNGGNCSGCEWAEILDLDGKQLASDRETPTDYRLKHFKRVYAQLGLPKAWPRSSFSWIPLSRSSKGDKHD